MFVKELRLQIAGQVAASLALSARGQHDLLDPNGDHGESMVKASLALAARLIREDSADESALQALFDAGYGIEIWTYPAREAPPAPIPAGWSCAIKTPDGVSQVVGGGSTKDDAVADALFIARKEGWPR